MQAVGRLDQIKSRNRRGAQRRKLRLGATLSSTGDDVIIRDISTSGMLIETKAELATFEQLQMELPEVGERIATVIWNSGQYFGCEFHEPVPKSALSAALVRSPFTEPAAAQVEDPESDEAADDRFGFGVRLRVITGASLILWALILWAVGII